MPKIYTLIEGGCVQAIYGDATDVEITLIDKDNYTYEDEQLAFLDNLPQQPYSDFATLKQSIDDLTQKTVKLKLEDLKGEQLNWAAAVALGLTPTLLPSATKDALEVHDADLVDMEADTSDLNYLHDWTLTGPIIEREMLTVGPAKHQGFMAWTWPKTAGYWGDTPQEVILKAVIHSKLGDEVEIPKELV